MITGFLTFFIIFAVIGSILYGRRLIKTEKTDTVFGNPERTKGGMHWVVVGTSFLILSWLYYSWAIAKSFYPKSANELCQVAKVNESLLSLKYLFPIEERQHKSTALIKRENINIGDKIVEIQSSPNLKGQDKELFVSLLNKTRLTIPLLTNERYIETETKKTIKKLTNRIRQLTEDFPKDSYPPPLSDEEENKRIEATKKQLGWGATGMEVPPLPETKRGLKFHTAAQELNEISDEFFSMRNHNPEYLKLLKEIKDLIPHRDPFLFLDRCNIIEIGCKGVGYRYFPKNEFFFKGHFPKMPIVPGVILIEALAQTAGVVVSKNFEKHSNKSVLFLSISKAKFRKPVVPEDTIEFYVEFINKVKSVYKFKGVAFKSEIIVCEAEFSAMITNS